jgi:ribokinase
VRLAAVSSAQLRVAVVGHVEWVQFGRVQELPAAGEVAHARDAFEEPAGGGAVAAVALARLAGSCTLVTALGEDEPGRRSVARLAALGVDARSSEGPHGSTRRAVTLVDDHAERTITTFGPRLDPRGDDEAAWAGLERLDAAYFTAGDELALRRVRAASRVLVASPRARRALGAGVELDALVLSARDPIELDAAAGVEGDARVVVHTEGERGGRWRARSGEQGRWKPATPPGPVVDSYGCGDTFAAALAYAIAAGLPLEQALVDAARAGAECLTFAGPYGRA